MSNGLSDLMKQAQAMQSNIKKAQDDLVNMRVEGTAGAGMVTVTLTGRYEAKKISIAPELFKEESKEMLEDLVTAAINDAVHKVEEGSKGKMGNLMSGVNMPENFDINSLLKGS